MVVTKKADCGRVQGNGFGKSFSVVLVPAVDGAILAPLSEPDAGSHATGSVFLRVSRTFITSRQHG
jgi:hypothetical protein